MPRGAITINRLFLFAIRRRESGTLLLIGRADDPGA
jgi:hypothetical protein